MWKIQLFRLNFDEREEQAVSQVLKSGWLTMGENISLFERKFSHFLGEDARCLAVTNGTAALHMALVSLDVSQGDEVIIPSLTFVADLNTVRLVGATPVLADCGSLENWNVTADSIEARITSRTKAVIVVHYAGYPCDMESISKLCRDRNVYLIEDVAHAPGAQVLGRACGTWGDVGCFSFFSNKNISVGEGGMVVSRDPNIYQKLSYLRSHGMTTLTLDRHKGRATTYDVVTPGLNYRMDEIRAALGLVQLEKLPDANLKREILTGRYRANLSDSDVAIPFSKEGKSSISAYHILPVLLPKNTNRNEVMGSLKRQGIQSSIHYPPFWSFSAYHTVFRPGDTPVAEYICDRQLTLPLYPSMSSADVDTVTSALLEAL